MANELRARGNFVSGTLSVALTNVATSMSSAGLANLPVVDTTNHAAIAIENEIVWVTAHTAGATTATILRAQEGTTAATHALNVAWQHGPTALDLNRLWNPPSCRVYNNAAISTTSGTPQALTFNTERFDTDAMHDIVTNTGRITINTPGQYHLYAAIDFAANATGYRQAYIRLNGTTPIAAQAFATAGIANGTQLTPSTVYRCIVGDYFEVVVSQNSTTTLNVTLGSNYSPEFGAIWLGS